MDDLIRTRNDKFESCQRKLLRNSTSLKTSRYPVSLLDFHYRFDEASSLLQDQYTYLRKLEKLPMETSFVEFWSMGVKLPRLGNMRPDCLFDFSQLAKVTEENYERSK